MRAKVYIRSIEIAVAIEEKGGLREGSIGTIETNQDRLIPPAPVRRKFKYGAAADVAASGTGTAGDGGAVEVAGGIEGHRCLRPVTVGRAEEVVQHLILRARHTDATDHKEEQGRAQEQVFFSQSIFIPFREPLSGGKPTPIRSNKPTTFRERQR